MLLTLNDKDYLLDVRGLTFEALLQCFELQKELEEKTLDNITAADLYRLNEFTAACFSKYKISVQDLNDLSPTDVLANTAQLLIECNQVIPLVEEKILTVGNTRATDDRPPVQSDQELILRIISDLVADGEDLNRVLQWPVLRYFDIVYYRCLEQKRSEPAPADLIDQILGI